MRTIPRSVGNTQRLLTNALGYPYLNQKIIWLSEKCIYFLF